jgi:hypothetical protein
MSESSPAKVIQRVLVSNGVAAVGGQWPIYIGYLPDDATDQSMAVYNTAGTVDGRDMRLGNKIIHPGVEVRIRSQGYEIAFNKAVEVARLFDSVKQLVIDVEGVIYRIQNISRTSDIQYMGVEEIGDRKRHNQTVNAIITIRKET